MANFKRRVPPRLPKPRKRDADPAPGTAYPSPRSNVIGPISLSNTSAPPPNTRNGNGRARGYSGSGGSYPPLNQTGAPTAGWGSGYPMNAGGPRGGGPLPPLTVPSDPPPLYGHQGHMGPISPAEDTPPSTANGYPPVPSYSSHANRELMGGPPPSHHYPYAVAEPQSASTAWSSPNNSTPSHSASLSSLLNPPNGSSYSRGPPGSNQMPYVAPFGSVHPSSGQHSPDGSRPNTGYSAISGYDEAASPASHVGFDYSRPNSSHHRGVSPPGSRPSSSHRQTSGSYGAPSLSIRRTRKHSQAMSPYPSPYADDQRTSTSPHPDAHDRDRTRNMIPPGHPSEHYSYNPTHAPADFAYSAVGPGDGDWVKGTRPSTSASSLSTTTTESPDAGTPPVTSSGQHRGDFGHEADVNRCKSLLLCSLLPPSSPIRRILFYHSSCSRIVHVLICLWFKLTPTSHPRLWIRLDERAPPTVWQGPRLEVRCKTQSKQDFFLAFSCFYFPLILSSTLLFFSTPWSVVSIASLLSVSRFCPAKISPLISSCLSRTRNNQLYTS